MPGHYGKKPAAKKKAAKKLKAKNPMMPKKMVSAIVSKRKK